MWSCFRRSQIPPPTMMLSSGPRTSEVVRDTAIDEVQVGVLVAVAVGAHRWMQCGSGGVASCGLRVLPRANRALRSRSGRHNSRG